MRRIFVMIAAAALGLSAMACGPGEVGQNCAGAATEDNCVDGAICTPDRSDSTEPTSSPNGDTATCRTICESNLQCDGDMTCRRVSGSMLSSCQPPVE